MQRQFSAEVYDNPQLNAPVIRLSYASDDPKRDLVAEIALFYGSNLFRYRAGEHELIHCDMDLLKDRDWTGTFILWPIPNRVGGKQYEFEGQIRSLEKVKRKRGLK